MKKTAFLILMLLPLCAAAQTAQQKAVELLSKLDIYQKASLMQATSVAIDTFNIPDYNWWNEALHGVGRNGSATMFPEPIGMASSFDDELLLKCFQITSDEARVKYRQAKEAGTHKRYQFLTFWTPNVNIFRDPRWGRGMETYGEDPYLTTRMGLMVVKGLQGEDKDMKLVVKDSDFDAILPTVLGRYHHDSQFFLLNCKLSKMILDEDIDHAYELVEKDGKTQIHVRKEELYYENLDKMITPKWGQRSYYYRTTREGGNSGWLKDNLKEAELKPSYWSLTAKQTFNNKWDPEQRIRDLWKILAY